VNDFTETLLISCDWCYLPTRVGTGPHSYLARRGYQWHAVPTTWGASTFPLWYEGFPILPVSRELDWQGWAYYLAISLI